MATCISPRTKKEALEIIELFRVSDLQAVLQFGRVSRQGCKLELLIRCRILISTQWSGQLANRIYEVDQARVNSRRSWSLVRQFPDPSFQRTSMPLSTIPDYDNLPPPTQVQYARLPFFDPIRTIACFNVPVNRKHFPSCTFFFTDSDVDLILRGAAKVFLRIAPTVNISERQNDVLPSYFFLQCNGQPVINDNFAKPVGSPAHYLNFPADLTDKTTVKATVANTLHYFWLQSPVIMSFSYLPRAYTLAVQLVRCLPLEKLCVEIQQREPPVIRMIEPTKTGATDDVGLIATRHRVSLICPITQSLMVLPVKSVYCLHTSCFDLRPFLQMNERRLRWTCPLCRKSASFEALRVDQRLQTLLSSVPPNCFTVEMDSSPNPLVPDYRFIVETASQGKHDPSRSTDSQIKRNSSTDSLHGPPLDNDYVILSSGEESEGEDDASSEHSSSAESPADADGDETDENLDSSSTTDPTREEDTVKDACDSIPQQQGQKRKDCSTPAATNPEHKRAKPSPWRPTDIDAITLSSGESNDVGNPIF